METRPEPMSAPTSLVRDRDLGSQSSHSSLAALKRRPDLTQEPSLEPSHLPPRDLPAEPTPDHALVWHEERLFLLDQRYLPARSEFLEIPTASAAAKAIKDMVVRGAPAIGIAAAYGVVLAARDRFRQDPQAWPDLIQADLQELAASRPTAVNLFWALERMRRCLAGLHAGLSDGSDSDPVRGQLIRPDAQARVDAQVPTPATATPEQADTDPTPALLAEALAIHAEDIAANRRMGQLGASLIQGPTAVITHCNAGALATGGFGTALGVIRQAWAEGRISYVYADETRPWLQGTRLTAWELAQDGIPVTLQADGAAASLMAQGGIGWVIVGADRIAANGDVANKIGTYGLAILARHHGIRFMVAAPTSTIDWGIADGRAIPIEDRDPGEVLACGGNHLGPAGVGARNPVFDVTPAALVDAIVTERGIVERPTKDRMRALLATAKDQDRHAGHPVSALDQDSLAGDLGSALGQGRACNPVSEPLRSVADVRAPGDR